MARYTVAVCVLCLLTCLSVAGQETIYSAAGDKVYAVTITAEALKASPAWNEAEQNHQRVRRVPPLEDRPVFRFHCITGTRPIGMLEVLGTVLIVGLYTTSFFLPAFDYRHSPTGG